MDDLVVNLLEKTETRYYGKYRAFVADNADPENRGRLRLRIPAILGEDVLSGWALPCAPYGGTADQGFFFIPENDAGVWVEFEAGLLDYPVWVGTFWAKPGGTTEVPKPADAQSPPTTKVITTKKGHTIQLEDAEGKEAIIIKHKGNAFFSIDKNGSVLISNQKGSHVFLSADQELVTIMEQHKNLVTMSADGVLVVNANGVTLEMKGDNVRLLSAGTIQISGKNIVLQGSSINLGEGANNGAILSSLFGPLFDSHTHPTALGPSGPPIPVPPAPLSNPLSPAFSQVVKVK
jgi:hypothetical protein